MSILFGVGEPEVTPRIIHAHEEAVAQAMG